MRIVENQLISGLSGGVFNHELETSVSGLNLKLSRTAVTWPTFISNLGSVRISVHLRTSSGEQIRIYNNQRILSVLDFGAFSEGTAIATPSGTNFTDLEFYVPFCPEGALVMKQNERFEIEITGLSALTGGSISVWGQEMAQKDYRVIKFHNISISAGQEEQSFGIQRANFVGYTVNTSLLDVLETHTNGESPKRYLSEIKNAAYQANDAAIIAQGGSVLAAGYVETAFMRSETMTNLRVTLDPAHTGYSVYTVHYVPVGEPAEAVAANLGLYDTAERAENQAAVEKQIEADNK